MFFIVIVFTFTEMPSFAWQWHNKDLPVMVCARTAFFGMAMAWHHLPIIFARLGKRVHHKDDKHPQK